MEGNEIRNSESDEGVRALLLLKDIGKMESRPTEIGLVGKDFHNLEISQNLNYNSQLAPINALVTEVITRNSRKENILKRRNEVLAKYQAQVQDNNELYEDPVQIDVSDSDFSDHSDCSDDDSDAEPNVPKTQEEEAETYKRDVEEIERYLAQDIDRLGLVDKEYLGKNSRKERSKSSKNINVMPAKKCYDGNKKCLEFLIKLEEDLTVKLEKIKVQYVEVTNRVEHCVSYKDKSRASFFGRLTRLGIPYFKDKQFFHCPSNADYHKKISRKEYLKNHFVNDLCWTRRHFNLISGAIRKWEIEGLEIDKANEVEALSQLLKATDDAEEVERLTKNIIAVESKCFDDWKLKDLVGKRKGNYDWLMISATVLDGEKTAEECIAMWDNYLNPNTNKSDWTAEEDLKLKEVATEYGVQDWDAIGSKLGTNRPAYLCFNRFRSELHTEVSGIRFTKEEDSMLKHQIENTRYGNYISWSKLEFLMKERNKGQLYRRWAKLQPNHKTGKFSDHEDLLLLSGVREFGNNNFVKLTKSLLPGRFPSDVRNRYLALIQNCTSGMWEKEEDKLLVNLVNIWGTDWKKIYELFHSRSKAQLRSRYNCIAEHYLKKSTCEADGKEVADLQTRHTMKTVAREQAKNKRLMKRFATMSKKELEEALMKKNIDKISNKRPKNGRMDSQFNEYFSVGLTYPQKPGRANRECEETEEEVQANAEMLKHLFTLFSAKLNFPESDDVILNDDYFSSGMKNSLIRLRSKDFTSYPITEPAANETEAISLVNIEETSNVNKPIELRKYNQVDVDKVTFSESNLGLLPNPLGLLISKSPLSYTKDKHFEKSPEKIQTLQKCVVTKQTAVCVLKKKKKIVSTSAKLIQSAQASSLPTVQPTRSRQTATSSSSSTTTSLPNQSATGKIQTSSSPFSPSVSDNLNKFLSLKQKTSEPRLTVATSSQAAQKYQLAANSKLRVTVHSSQVPHVPTKNQKVIRLIPKTNVNIPSNLIPTNFIETNQKTLPKAQTQISTGNKRSSTITSQKMTTLPLKLEGKDKAWGPGIFSDSIMYDFFAASGHEKKARFMSRATQVEKSATDTMYMLPPSFATLCGLRTYLLSRDRLRTEYLKNISKESPVEEEAIYGNMSPEGEAAERLWKSRLDILFTWPGLMAVQEPKVDVNALGMRNMRTFVDSGDEIDDAIPAPRVKQRKVQVRPFKSSRSKPPSFVRWGQESEDVDDPDVVEVSQPPDVDGRDVDVFKPPTSSVEESFLYKKARQKRPRSPSQDSVDEEDVDDPDVIDLNQPSTSYANTPVLNIDRRQTSSASTVKRKGPRMIHTSPTRLKGRKRPKKK